ncbi:hypothetical protein [Nonomuraea typhae]|uniref:hypothetical protein n=1 Tax=Nonomuraea typhae TaxID=2603600 RepID=UPI0012FC0CB8|nr:hypothetical protein [Nonomuraea typhae]
MRVTLGTDRPDRVQVTHTVTMRADDPVAAAVMDGDLRAKDWVEQLLFRGPDPELTYTAPTITRRPNAPEIVLRIDGVLPEGADQRLTFVGLNPLTRPSLNPATHPLTSQTFRMEVAGGTIGKVSGRRPDEQGPAVAAFSGEPVGKDLRIDLARAGVEPEQPSADEPRTVLDELTVTLFSSAMTVPWILLLAVIVAVLTLTNPLQETWTSLATALAA